MNPSTAWTCGSCRRHDGDFAFGLLVLALGVAAMPRNTAMD